MDPVKIYITCCRKDYYFTKICIASIRYWNKTIPIYLLKDLSQGDFDTRLTEKIFQVSVAGTDHKNLFGYIKLQPYMQDLKERIILSDSDIVWLGDVAARVGTYTEDLLADSYSPGNAQEEMNKWYFNTELLNRHYGDYCYPGFLFNAGFYICDTTLFRKEEFRHIIIWKDHPQLCVENVFLCEDQGIVNYLTAKKIAGKEISFKSLPLQIWGYSQEADQYDLHAIKAKKDYPYVVHWFGRKTGLIGFFPGSRILAFYEKYYYSQLSYGQAKLIAARLKRTLLHLHYFIYESAKKVFYILRKKPIVREP